MEIKVLDNAFKMEDAYYDLINRSEKVEIENMDLIFYPYLLVTYSIDYGPRLRRLNTEVLCLIDLAREEYSIAKSKGSYKRVDAEESTVIPIKVDRDYAIKEAPRRIYGEILQSRKVLKTPDIIHKEDEVIYKPFYLVEMKNDMGEFFHILYDAVFGKFTLLDA